MTPHKITLGSVGTSDKVQMVVSALHDYIINNALEPGTELPAESEMAKQLGVSKFSMREALRIAQAQGLVEISQGRRTRVADVSVAPVTDIMHLLFKRSDMDTALLELTETRMCLECYIARLAAERITEEQLDAMQACIEEMRRNLDDFAACVQSDVGFHDILVRSTKNRVFEIMLSPLAELLQQSRVETLSISGIQKAIDEHTNILSALRKKDPALAEAFMRQHLATAEENIKEHSRLKTHD